jgi:superfamily II DNA or RNA helicase
MNLPKIIDNKRKILADVLNKVIDDYSEISIATGYWDIHGIKIFLTKFKTYKKIRLLLGRELLIPRHKLNKPEPDYPDRDIFDDLEALSPDKDIQTAIKDIKELIEKEILEVRVYRKSFLHAKSYIFGNFESNKAIGIIGSSNFTGNGLNSNTELNALEEDERVVLYEPRNTEQETGHLFWFNELWKDEATEAWSGRFIELLEQSPAGDMLFSPYEVYIKTLYELYQDELEEESLGNRVGQAYELLEFQRKNIQQLLKKLKKHKTAMLSDSVGLGKTITAIGVMQEYLDSPDGRKRVVVICPKSLKSQWTKETMKQSLDIRSIITLQNLNEIEAEMNFDHIAEVSLFVIDESHNLRKTTGTRYLKLLEWIRNNKKAHVLLLTATPINNELQDITNQILLGTRGDTSSIYITTIDSETGNTITKDFVSAVEDLQKKIKRCINNDEPEKIDYSEIKSIMSKVIREIVVRRTRQGIEKEYGKLLINGELKGFPKSFPENLPYRTSLELNQKILKLPSEKINLTDIYKKDTDEIIEKCDLLKHPLNQLDLLVRERDLEDLKSLAPTHFIFQLILMLGFIPYRWKIYQTKYYGKTPAQIKDLRLEGDESRELQQQRGIYGIFRTMFLKRLESSIRAIKNSVDNYKKKLSIFKEGIDKNHIISLKNSDVYFELLNNTDESNYEDFQVGEEVLDHLDPHKYVLEVLKKDIEIEFELLDIISAILNILEKDDSKISALIAKLKEFGSEKVLVFSYFADTIEYLRESLVLKSSEFILNEEIAFLSSRNRNDAENLAGKFSPISKNHTLKDDETELKYLFSTDILSEGQNLQDAGIIINYDLHWNPVRMIQRNGRINRLGSKHDEVFIYNMHPEKNIESYLKLVKRLESKINIINQTIGNDQSVLGETANPIEYTETLENIYSNDDKKRIEALIQSERASDFLLVEDEFIIDLKRFHQEESAEYKKLIYGIAAGKWSSIPNIKLNTGTPEIIVFSNLMKSSQILDKSFIKMNRHAEDISLVNNLEALYYLQVTKEESARMIDKISLNKKNFREIASDPNHYLSIVKEELPLKGQQQQLLKTMLHLHYSREDIEMVAAAFNTTNHLDKKTLSKLLRSIIKLQRENKSYQAELDKLIRISRESSYDKKERLNPDQIVPLLFYVKHNK